MKPGMIVYRGRTEKGTEIVVRYPDKDDAPEMTRYINTLSNEYTYILFQGEQNTLKQEKTYLRSLLKKIKEQKAIYLLVFHDDMVIGGSDLTMKEKAEQHVGSFGISVAREFRGQGIGKLLMNLVLKEANTHLQNLRICVLGVFSDNDLAASMYQKFGFIQYGKLPKGLKHKDCYVDHIFMYKNMNSVHEKE